MKKTIFGSGFIIAALYFLVTSSGFGYTFWQSSEMGGISWGWKIALIITHLLPFVIVPISMKVFYERTDYLVSKGLNSPFALYLGLPFQMVAIAFEIGWHIQQNWFYQNDFTFLNFLFYAFLISSFALWADAFARNHLVDLLFVGSLIAISILYPIGASLDISALKIPIYIALTIVFGFLTYRAYKVLQDWRIIFVPIFSVGVNLFFVFLLAQHQSNPVLNPLFHILHDLAGTEMGIIIFTYLVYINPRRQSQPVQQSEKADT
ncbi:hypothetical protein B4U84_01420 [Westiellopsis prolifica IICB1]|nr:hypothetical protein B4U84_01420 [Westiellopsis prolifica IICB1]